MKGLDSDTKIYLYGIGLGMILGSAVILGLVIWASTIVDKPKAIDVYRDTIPKVDTIVVFKNK